MLYFFFLRRKYVYLPRQKGQAQVVKLVYTLL